MAVQLVLHGEPPPPPEGVEEIAAETAVSDDVIKRLKTLRTDTGANGLMLSTLDGRTMFQVSSDHSLNLPALSGELVKTIQNSFSLADYLDSDVPNTIQYHAGDKVELYCANIGRDYFLTTFFDIQSRRGRIGTIWVFTQRAIKDLVEMLPMGEEPENQPAAKSEPSPVTAEPVKEAEPVVEPAPMPEAEPKEETPVIEDYIEFDEADLDDLFGEADLEDAGGEIDDFWDDATGNDISVAKGLSLEEAQKQGLIPSDLDLNDKPE
jgi:hypothetical protein